jgi:hypothetical protein
VFADESGVRQYLPGILEMTRQIFPEAQRIEAMLEEDAETTDDRRIILQVDVRLAVPQAVAAADRWHRDLFQCCPATHACFFCLGMQLVK